eukprot:370222-Hanusia_phi.AAC.2
MSLTAEQRRHLFNNGANRVSKPNSQRDFSDCEGVDLQLLPRAPISPHLLLLVGKTSTQGFGLNLLLHELLADSYELKASSHGRETEKQIDRQKEQNEKRLQEEFSIMSSVRTFRAHPLESESPPPSFPAAHPSQDSAKWRNREGGEENGDEEGGGWRWKGESGGKDLFLQVANLYSQLIQLIVCKELSSAERNGRKTRGQKGGRWGGEAWERREGEERRREEEMAAAGRKEEGETDDITIQSFWSLVRILPAGRQRSPFRPPPPSPPVRSFPGVLLQVPQLLLLPCRQEAESS